MYLEFVKFFTWPKKLLVENDNTVFGTQKGLEARICEIWPGMNSIQDFTSFFVAQLLFNQAQNGQTNRPLLLRENKQAIYKWHIKYLNEMP